MEASLSRYGRSHTVTSLEAETEELLFTDLNPTTQTVRHLLHVPNVVFGYGIYQGLPHLHPGFSSEIHRWIRHNGLVTPIEHPIETYCRAPPDVEQPHRAREATSILLTRVVSAVSRSRHTVMPTMLTEVAQHLGVHHRASAQVAAVLESQLGADLNGICRLLGVSSRTLQRRLREEHTTFESLRSATRLTLAMEAIRRRQNLTEVAHGAGYADSAHFAHKFKQACGMPPSVAKLLLSGPVQPERLAVGSDPL